MKTSIALIACINLLLAHSLQAGFLLAGYRGPDDIDLERKIALLIEDVEKGRKEKAVLNENMDNCYFDPIPLINLVQEQDEIPLQLVERLLKAGADPNIRNPEGESALQKALTYGSTKSVKLLLEHGARAAENSHMLRILANESGREIERIGIKKFQRREAEIIENTRLLLQYGADANDIPKYTVFHDLIDHYAFCSRNKKHNDSRLDPQDINEMFKCVCTLLKLFLRHGASPYKEKFGRIKTDNLRTPDITNAIAYARREKVPELANYLEKSRRVYWVMRLLSGKKEGGSFGPFPVEIAECIACYEYGFSWNEL